MPEQFVRLAEEVAGTIVGHRDVTITDVTHDSRSARAGTLFVAVRGASVDGHDFVPDLPAGSAACVTRVVDTDVPQVVVEDTRRALGPLAHLVHGRPSDHLTVVGVTGTNGKTSVSYLVSSILRAAGHSPACIGTTGVVRDGLRQALPRTTPEASDLHRLLASLRDDGVDSVALEVSSHALALHRVDGVRFAAVGFTNLSRDHLDFHRDLDDYFETKARLFERCGTRVINVDDPHGRRLADRYPSLEVGRDVIASNVETAIDSTSFDLHLGGVAVPVMLPMGGRFMVENCLVAAGLAMAIGIEPRVIAAGLAEAPRVPGRFEPIDAGQDFAVIVDYAHGPESVAAVIASARALTPGRVIAVLGAGGDRDREKRGPMGQAAVAADVVVLTSDNPRWEDPSGIIAQLRAGTEGGNAAVIEEPDRRGAIGAALASAGGGDTVLILGKGHETTQEVAGRTIPFDDSDVARSILEEMRR